MITPVTLPVIYYSLKCIVSGKIYNAILQDYTEVYLV